MKYQIKQISLKIPDGSEGGPTSSPIIDTRIAVQYYVVVDSKGWSDEVRYQSFIEALNSLCDCDHVMELARRDFHEEGWKQDETDLANYISDNIESLAERAGYRLIRNLKWKE